MWLWDDQGQQMVVVGHIYKWKRQPLLYSTSFTAPASGPITYITVWRLLGSSGRKMRWKTDQTLSVWTAVHLGNYTHKSILAGNPYFQQGTEPVHSCHVWCAVKTTIWGVSPKWKGLLEWFYPSSLVTGSSWKKVLYSKGCLFPVGSLHRQQ